MLRLDTKGDVLKSKHSKTGGGVGKKSKRGFDRLVWGSDNQIVPRRSFHMLRHGCKHFNNTKELTSCDVVVNQLIRDLSPSSKHFDRRMRLKLVSS